ncbi:ANTAR domain-containing protein [Streptomyces sp. NPDC058867]|uniref:ANTAR domain-containing protein n=1 Tax=unclassified Streptomyces TaxID=2593676 RepID=UPI0036BD47B4
MRGTDREARLAAALVAAADTLTASFEATEHLRRVADHCVELLGARAAGFMLIKRGGTVSLAGSTRPPGLALDLLRAQTGGGPGPDAYGSGRPVPPVPLGLAHARGRWPLFTERALRHGVTATFAVPLRRRARLLGALNVFASAPPGGAAGGGGELRLAQALADAAAVGLENHRAYTRCRTLAGQLQEALSSRVRVEQAKGMLAERWGTPADHAFVALRRYARRHRLALDLVAQAVIDRALDDAELRYEPGDTA